MNRLPHIEENVPGINWSGVALVRSWRARWLRFAGADQWVRPYVFCRITPITSVLPDGTVVPCSLLAGLLLCR
jgi:hypothetical protein